MKSNPACPNDEMLIDFLEHRLNEKEQVCITQHLATCLNCREQVATYVELISLETSPPSPFVPPDVTQTAVNAVLSQQTDRWPHKLTKGVRQWIAKGTAALDRLKPIPAPNTVAMRRGSPLPLSPAPARCDKQFDDLRVAIEIEYNDIDNQAVIRIESLPPTPSDSIRVAVYQRDRETTSQIMTHDPVFFEEIQPGNYTLVFTRQGDIMGTYPFEIKDQP